VKHTKTVSRTGKKVSRQGKCKHQEAFAVATFQDLERNSAYMTLECPQCGGELCLVGALVEHIGA